MNSLKIELALLLLVVLAAILAPAAASKSLSHLYRLLGRIARRPKLAILLAGALPVCVRLLLLPVLPVPEPFIQDEFSHLLVADTLASGRFANPTHPFSDHFETFHVLQRPTYASQYPAGTGLVMAAGKVIANCPWSGIVFSVFLMGASACWMLRAWVSPRWALVGGILLAVRLGILGYWMNSYVGGALGTAAGAMLLGGFGYLRKRGRWSDAAWIGLGTVLLAAVRPYEGLLVCAPVYLILVIDLFRGPRSASFRLDAIQTTVLTFVLLIGGSLYMMHNHAVTGSPFVLPYQVAQSQYGTVQALPGMRVAEKPLPNEQMRRYQNMQTKMAQRRLDGASILKNVFRTAASLAYNLLGPLLVLPFAAMPWILRNKAYRPLILIGVVFAGGILLHVFFQSHYAAPGTALLYLFATLGLKRFPLLRWPRRTTGLFLSRAIPVACVLSVAFSAAAAPWLKQANLAPQNTWDCCTLPGNVRRAEILRHLRKTPGGHLVFVRYSPEHSVFKEWVYNDADIDNSRVVWARELDPDSNARLMRHFEDRAVWLIEPDKPDESLRPYAPPMP